MEEVSTKPRSFFRLSPVNSLKCFAIKRGDIRIRFDVKYFALRENLKSKFPVSFLGHLVASEPNYGSSARAIERISEEQPRYIRITDFGRDGIPTNHLFLTPEPLQAEHFLDQHDILFC